MFHLHLKCKLHEKAYFFHIEEYQKLKFLLLPYIICVRYHAGFQYRWRNHEYCGGYLEYCRGCSVLWDIMVYVGNSLSTVGVFSAVEDIMSIVEIS